MRYIECVMKRYALLDTIRGITIISMLAFHLCWDLMYFGMGVGAGFLYGRGAYIWQQSICWTFIMLSGFCFSMGRHHLKRGLLALGGGIIITVVTLIVIPDERDIFGVLWLIGISTLIMIPIDRFIHRKKDTSQSEADQKNFTGQSKSASCGKCIIMTLVSFFVFLFAKHINSGYLGFSWINTEGVTFYLPQKLYRGYFMTLAGFTDPNFYSSDYFSIIPWFFLFATGYFLSKVVIPALQAAGQSAGNETDTISRVFSFNIRPLSFIGRHSLIIYMLHQVVLYGAVYLIYALTHGGIIPS